MPRREVIPMSTSREVNRKVSEMSKQKTRRSTLTWQQEEAKRLRMESVRLEKNDFAKKTPTVRDLHGSTPEGETRTNPDAQLGPTDIAEQDFLNPTFDDQLSRAGSSQTGVPIMEEIAEMERTGTLRPFVEGEPIGKRQNFRRKPVTPVYNRDEIMEQKCTAMLELRAKNDRDLAQLLGDR